MLIQPLLKYRHHNLSTIHIAELLHKLQVDDGIEIFGVGVVCAQFVRLMF